MKHFVIKTLLFLVIVAAADFLFGWMMDGVLRGTMKGDWGKNNYIFSGVRSDVIILGSSRAIHHYDPQILSDTLGLTCYNCGEDGMGILLMYARYRAIRDRYVPRLVIYEVLPEYDLQEESDNLKYLKFLRPYYGTASIGQVVTDISSLEPLKLLSRMYCYNSVFIDIIAQSISKSPQTAGDYSYFPLEKQMQKEPKKNADGLSVPCDPLKLTYLKDIILQCKNDGTSLVFIASPIYKPATDTDYSPLKELCHDYGVPFINHYCDARFCNNPHYFADGGHLNKTGAELFTALAASEIKNSIEK